MKRIVLLGVVLSLPFWGSLVSAISQSALYKTVKVQSGKPVRLGAYTALRKDCTPGPLPEVTVKQSPEHGVLLVKRGNLTTRSGGKCPAGTQAPVQIAFYQSRAGYIGSDSVNYEVKTGTAVSSYSITISVTAAPPPLKQRDIDL